MIPIDQLTVLLVDDVEDFRVIWRLLLRNHPRVKRIREAGSGHDAIRQLILDGPADIVVSDVLMPDGSGQELADFARRNFPSMPVLLTSAEIGVAREHLQPGGISFLDKARTTSERFGDVLCHLARPMAIPAA